jgi:glycerate kinase
MTPLRVLVAPDKLRGTATAGQAAAAIAAGVRSAGGSVDSCPLSDGGEGFLESLGGPNRTSQVADALGRTIEVPWRLDGELAVIETALLSTAVLADGPGPAEAEAATSTGAGELIAAALRAGAHRVLVGLGGSAFSDGGFGALAGLAGLVPFAPDRQVLLACDVGTGYLDAARVFGPQKGADGPAVERLSQRLAEQAVLLADRFGRDATVPGTELRSGLDMVAERVGLAERLAAAELVITAEGRLDESSLTGKVAGGLIQRAGCPVWVIAGSVQPGLTVPDRVGTFDLTAEFGADRARSDTAGCLTEAADRIVRPAAEGTR